MPKITIPISRRFMIEMTRLLYPKLINYDLSKQDLEREIIYFHTFAKAWLGEGFEFTIPYRGTTQEIQEGQSIRVNGDDRILSSHLKIKTLRTEGIGKDFFAERKSLEGAFEFSNEISFHSPESTIIPLKESTLSVEADIWTHFILTHAKSRLDELTHFSPIDFFVMIPCLHDKKFRDLFFKKLLERSSYEFDFAKKWISICFPGSQCNKILRELDDLVISSFLQRETVIGYQKKKENVFDYTSKGYDDYDLPVSEEVPASMSVAVASYAFREFREIQDSLFYLLDPECAPHFKKEFARVMCSLSLKEYQKFLEEIKNNPAGSGWSEQYNSLYESIPRKVRFVNGVKIFLHRHPKRTAVVCLGLVLGIIGGSLAATGILAPFGIPLGLTGAYMVAPACLAAPPVLSGLYLGTVKMLRWLGCCMRGRKPSRELDATSANAKIMKVYGVNEIPDGQKNEQASRLESSRDPVEVKPVSVLHRRTGLRMRSVNPGSAGIKGNHATKKR